jgi:hypothetical protein
VSPCLGRHKTSCLGRKYIEKKRKKEEEEKEKLEETLQIKGKSIF